MITDLLQLIASYLDIDEFYVIKDEYKLSVKTYCSMVKDILTGGKHSHEFNPITWASMRGYCEIVKYLYSVKKVECLQNAFEFAAKNNHLNVIKYLYSIQAPGLFSAINIASSCGNLEILQYLHSVSNFRKIDKKIMNDAMYSAILHNRLNILKYLHRLTGINNLEYAVGSACENGDIEMLQYLVNTMHLSGTKQSMDVACMHGKMDMVKFLVSIGTKYTENAIGLAEDYGYDEIAEFLEKKMNN